MTAQESAEKAYGISGEMIEDNRIVEVAKLDNVKTEKVVNEREMTKGYKLKLFKNKNTNEYELLYENVNKCDGYRPLTVSGFRIAFSKEVMKGIVSILRAELENNSDW